MRFFKKIILLSMTMIFVTLPITTQAARRNSNAFNHLITSPNNIFWQNNATVASHQNAFQHAVNRSNQINGIQFYHTNNDNLALVQAYTMYGGGDWGYWERRANYHYVAISGSTTGNFTTNQLRYVALHEIGHALGLVHQRQPIDSVMRLANNTPYSYSNYTELDRNNLNWGYGR